MWLPTVGGGWKICSAVWQSYTQQEAETWREQPAFSPREMHPRLSASDVLSATALKWCIPHSPFLLPITQDVHLAKGHSYTLVV